MGVGVGVGMDGLMLWEGEKVNAFSASLHGSFSLPKKEYGYDGDVAGWAGERCLSLAAWCFFFFPIKKEYGYDSRINSVSLHGTASTKKNMAKAFINSEF